MTVLRLQAEPRGVSKGARNGARRRGYVPAVFYGKDVEPTPIMVESGALRSAMKEGARHKLIQLSGPAFEQPQTVMIKDIQFDPARETVHHVDFLRPAPGRRLHVRVPVVIQGDERLVRRGLVLEHQMHEVDCECLPDNVPEAIYIDAASLQPGQHVSLGDLSAPPGVKISGHRDAVVVVVAAPMATMVPPDVAAIALGE